jgi:hypothetical protein
VQPGNHYDPPLGTSLKVYIGVQFFWLIALGLAMTYLAGQLSGWELSLMFAYLLASLVLLGWLMDAAGPRWEWLRLLLSLPLIAILPAPLWVQAALFALVALSAIIYVPVSRKPAGVPREQGAN